MTTTKIGANLLVSCEVRIKLADAEGHIAMLVRGNELRRSGRRVLIPFGGAISDKKTAWRIAGMQTPDLRFDATRRQYLELKRWFDSLDDAHLRREAMREFWEEACDERGLLTPQELAECQLVYMKREHVEGPSVRNATEGQATQYMIAVVQVLPSDPVLQKLKQLSESPTSLLEFVSPELLQTGGKTDGQSKVNALYAYLL